MLDTREKSLLYSFKPIDFLTFADCCPRCTSKVYNWIVYQIAVARAQKP